MDAVNAVLAKKLGLTGDMPVVDAGGGPDDVVLSPMRQVRRALARAADGSVGMLASVLGIADEELEAEALIETSPKDWVVIGLRDDTGAGLTGLFLIDPALRSALVEMQTMGKLLPDVQDERPVTRADAQLTIPFAAQLLSELADVGFGSSDLDPNGFDLGVMENLRTAGLVMTQGLYRVWKISVQVGGGERQGELLIAMRPKTNEIPDIKAPTAAWSDSLRRAVALAPTDLDAVLTRMTLPMGKVENFKVGQVLNLAGTTVGSVKLVGPGGEHVATARLGQVAGKRAIRLEPEIRNLQEGLPRAAAMAPMDGGALMDNAMMDADMTGALPDIDYVNDTVDLGMTDDGFAAPNPMDMGAADNDMSLLMGQDDLGLPSHEDALLQNGLDADLAQDFPRSGIDLNLGED